MRLVRRNGVVVKRSRTVVGEGIVVGAGIAVKVWLKLFLIRKMSWRLTWLSLLRSDVVWLGRFSCPKFSMALSRVSWFMMMGRCD